MIPFYHRIGMVGLLRLRPVVGIVLRHRSAINDSLPPPRDLAPDGVVEIQVNVVDLSLREPEKRSVRPTPSHHAASSRPPLPSEKATARA